MIKFCKIPYCREQESDSQRLLMLSDFLIVGTSLVFPFADQVSWSLAKKEFNMKPQEPGKVQPIIGRIKTFPVEKGAGMSFEFSPDETAAVVKVIKEKISAEKEKQEKQTRDKYASSLMDAIRKKDIKAVDELLEKIGSADIRGDSVKIHFPWLLCPEVLKQ
jgi:hypothetical protein